MDRDEYNTTFADLHNHGVQAGYIAGNVHYHVERSEIPPSPSLSIPFGRDPDFVDHGVILNQLHHGYVTTKPKTALVGSRGVGKSHFAIEYAYQIHNQSPDTWIFWVYANNAARFEQSYQDIADTVKLPGRQDPKKNIFRLVHNWLRDSKNGKWVLILDKVDDARFLFSCQHDVQGQAEYEHSCTDRPLREYLPQCKHGFILITSRSRDEARKLVEQRDIIMVEPMDEVHARVLFEKKLGEQGRRRNIINLARALEFNPFAIVQAAVYISDPDRSYSVEQYLKEVERSDDNNPSVTHLRNARDPHLQNLITNPSSIEDRRNCLSSLYFPEIHKRNMSINFASNACVGFSEHPLFHAWFNRTHMNEYQGLLLISGKPGSGKSTAMKAAATKLQQEANLQNTSIATYSFDAKGEALERSRIGLLRSILYQILSKQRSHLEHFMAMYSDKIQHRRYNAHETLVWQVEDLEKFLVSMFEATSYSRTIMFIDALDECNNEDDTREIAYFLRDIALTAYKAGTPLDICISSRHFSFVDLKNQPIIAMETCNEMDMRTYIQRKFALTNIPEDVFWLALREEIVGRSTGIFLWVVLVVDMILKAKDRGHNKKYLRNLLHEIPQALAGLYRNLVTAEDIEDVELLAKILQWAILALKPLRLREWHQIFALIRESKAPTSLKQWRESSYFTENDDQLEKQLRLHSRGLLEVVSYAEPSSPQSLPRDQDSDVGYAGSLELEQGETRLVQVIHESVRQFLLNEGGFILIDKTWNLGNGHLSIMENCLNYLQLTDWDSLVEARLKFCSLYTGDRDNNSVASFGSASSYEGRNDSDSASRVFQFMMSPPDSERLYETDGNTSDVAAIITSREQGNEIIRENDGQAHRDAAIETSCGRHSADDHDLASLRSIEVEQSPTVPLSAKPRLLGESPFLLHYSTQKLFSHAKLAERHGSDPAQIMNRVSHMWERYKLLREDLPRERSLIVHCMHLNLLSWIRCLETFDQTYKDAFAAPCEVKNYDAISVLALQEIVNSGRQVLDKTLLQWIVADDEVRLFRCWYDNVKDLVKTGELSQDTLLDYINRFDPLKTTALSWAYTSSSEIFQRLLELGADPNKTEQGEYSPLLFVCERCSGAKLLILLKELMKAGANTYYTRFDGRYPFHILCRDNISVPGIKLLLEYSTDPNVKDASGGTPLHYIVCWDGSSDFKWSIIELMLSYGADLNSADYNGQTPLQLAATNGDRRLYQLIKQSIKANTPNDARRTSALIKKGIIGLSVILVLVMVIVLLYIVWPSDNW